MTAIDKRMYFLMLSPADGQIFANEAGFQFPSEEVQEAETYDIIARWALLTATGIMEDAIETSDWLMELDGFKGIPDGMLDQLRKLVVAHSVGLVNKLLDSDKIALINLVEDDDDE